MDAERLHEITNQAQQPSGLLRITVPGAEEPVPEEVAPAIANALARRYSVRIRDLPMTPEKIWTALRSRRSDGS